MFGAPICPLNRQVGAPGCEHVWRETTVDRMVHMPGQDVVIKLTAIDELFNAPDINPFSGNEIEVLGEAALMRAARRMLARRVRHWHEARLVIQLPPDQITPDLQAQTQAAIQRYCAAKIEDNRLTIHLSRIRSAIGLVAVAVISALVILIGLLLFNTIFAGLPSEVGALVAACISVFVWVILWDPDGEAALRLGVTGHGESHPARHHGHDRRRRAAGVSAMAETVETQLVLQLQRVDELFNAPERNPFSTRAVEVLGEAGFDLLWKRMVKRWPRRSPLRRVNVQLPPDQLAPDLTEATRAAWHRYCAAKIEDNQQQRSLITRKALRLVGYSLLVLVFALVLLFLFYVAPLQFLPGWLRGILSILAIYAFSLALWDSLDSLIFDWAPFVRDNATYQLIDNLEVIIEPWPASD